MRYFYFNPFNKQYYFPEGFRQRPLFVSFYQPYTFAGSVLWFVWKNTSLLRSLCKEDAIDTLLPIDRFKKYLPSEVLMAINRGTKGVEQKMTILACDLTNGEECFMKYAESKIARKNVDNEGKTLGQLKHLNFIPKLYLQVSEKDFSIIKTNILKGKRLDKQNVDEQVLKVLIELSKQKVKTDRVFDTTLQSCFAHGDFCPWNMMLDSGKLNVFDWEMAGSYPLGYDLFTFIFQTSFLIDSKKSIEKLLQENKKLIENYFKVFEVQSWRPYLLAYALEKIRSETLKNNKCLLLPFQELKKYVEKL